MEVTLSGSVVACAGQCTAAPPFNTLLSKNVPGITYCISSADQGNKTKNNGCLYSMNRAFAACMEGPKFVIYNFPSTGQPIVVSAYMLRDAAGRPVDALLGPFTACMDASGELPVVGALVMNSSQCTAPFAAACRHRGR